MTTLILAVVIGGAFGFALDRVGATNPGYIIRMLNFQDLHLMRTILLAIGVASILLFLGLLSGLVDPRHLDVKAAYWGAFVGGLLLGAGFAVSGFCPGTGLAAAATGRKDAMFFVLGGLLGAAGYMLSYGWVESTGILNDVLGGKTMLGTVEGAGYPALLPGWPGELTGLLLGAALVAAAAFLPRHLSRPTSGESEAPRA